MLDASFQTDGANYPFIRSDAVVKIRPESHVRFVGVLRSHVGITVDGHVVDTVAGLFQHQLCPFYPFGRAVKKFRPQWMIFPAAYCRSHQFNIRICAFHHFAELGVLPRIFLGCFHTDLAGTIHFVADTPVFDIMRFGKSMCTAQFYQRGIAGAVAILHPIRRLSHIAVAAIDAKIRFYSRRPAKTHEFIGAVCIFDDTMTRRAPPRRTFLPRPDAVHPPVSRNKITAGEADIGKIHPVQNCHHIFTKIVFVGMGRIAQVQILKCIVSRSMLDVSAENIPVDVTYNSFRVNFDLVHQHTPEFIFFLCLNFIVKLCYPSL